jgi:hypothetical protein
MNSENLLKYFMFFTGDFEVNVFISTALDISLLSMYKAQLTVEVKFIWTVNLLKTKCNLLYIRNQSVPRGKHFPPRL